MSFVSKNIWLVVIVKKKKKLFLFKHVSKGTYCETNECLLKYAFEYHLCKMLV